MLPRPYLIRLAIPIQCYSTASKPRRRLDNILSLDHFLQRKKAISLWRTIIRDCRRIADQGSRKETLGFVRQEFERNKEVKDLAQIRYLISTGKTQWEGMERYISGL